MGSNEQKLEKIEGNETLGTKKIRSNKGSERRKGISRGKD